MKLGLPLPRRVTIIQQIVKKGSETTYPVEFQGKVQHFSIYRVSLDMPKYRLANGRTQAAQDEYLASNEEASDDFFTRDFESDEAQKVQHKILYDMLNEAGLLPELKKNQQREPLILNAQGYVVNGNRRLCAIRELYSATPKRYAHFSHVDVVVLPPCDERDIDELEARLQIKKDTKAEYSWITFSIMLRKRRQEHGYTDKELALLYDKKKNEIKQLLLMLDEVEKYLEERRQPKRYHLVQDEFAFRKLVEGRAKLTKEAEKDVFEKVAYCLIDDSSRSSGRLYKVIPEVEKYLPQVVERLEEELPLEEYTSPKKKTEVDELLGEISEKSVGLSKAINDPKHRETILEVVSDVVESERIKKKTKKDANAVLILLKNANTNLAEAITLLGKKTSSTGMKEQLDSIASAIKTLRNWLKNA